MVMLNLHLASTVLPTWLTLIVAGAGMILVGGYVLAIQGDRTPPSRRRLRTANGVVQMFLIGTVAYAAGLAPVANRSLFVLSWLLVVILTFVVVVLALLDIVNNLRLAMAERRLRQRELAEELARDLAAAGVTRKKEAGVPEGGRRE